MSRSAGGSLAARCVLLAPGTELSPGELVWDRAGRIVALRRPRGRVRDLCVLPGLVDAHAHLQIDPVDAPRRFLPWVRAVMGARARQTPDGQARAAHSAIRGLLSEGVTSVGEIDSTGLSPRALAAHPLAGRCYQELTGFHLAGAAAVAAVRLRKRRALGPVAAGLSPHAPYSVSADLFRAAFGSRQPLAIHCAEVPEEQLLLREGRGPFAELLRQLGRLPEGYRPPGVGAVRWLERLGVLGPRTQLVHCQELEPGDASRIAASGSPVAVCPGTIEWFGRIPPPVPEWLERGIPVALGTDSRASTGAFGMRAELAAAARLWPTLRPEQVFAMATGHGARALARPGLGRLRRGGRADLVAVPASSDRAAEHLEPFVRGDLPPVFVLAAGHRVFRASQRR